MNHRGFDIPGYNASTPTNLYPDWTQRFSSAQRRRWTGRYRNWDNISDYNNVWQANIGRFFGSS